jgi:hypothetical protein
MPSRPKVFRPPWLPRYSSERERKALIDAERESSSQRGYDVAWRKFRDAYLRDFPICSTPGCGKPATEVHHLRDVRRHPELRLVRSNVCGHCKPHHSAETAKLQSFKRQGEGGFNL